MGESAPRCSLRPLSGIRARLAGSGIENSMREPKMHCTLSDTTWCAPSVGRSTRPSIRDRCTVPRNAKQLHDEGLERIMKSAAVLSASRPMSRIAIRTGQHAPDPAGLPLSIRASRFTRSGLALYARAGSALRSLLGLFTARAHARPRLRVVSVEAAPPDAVFCLEAPGIGAFSLPAGMIVSNCDAGGYFIHREYPIIKPVTAIKMGYAR